MSRLSVFRDADKFFFEMQNKREKNRIDKNGKEGFCQERCSVPIKSDIITVLR